jgi:hypothetical protein
MTTTNDETNSLAETRWRAYLEGLSEVSHEVYKNRVQMYQIWCQTSGAFIIDRRPCLKFLTRLYTKQIFCTKTSWSINSIIGSYYECYTTRKAHEDLPLIIRMLKQSLKSQTVMKATTFTSKEIFRFLREAENCDDNLPRKVAISGLLPKSELSDMTIDQLS